MDEAGSADQMAWVELAQVVRIQLLKYACTIPAMNPGEIKDFVETCRLAHWLEEKSRTFDRDVELWEQRCSYGE